MNDDEILPYYVAVSMGSTKMSPLEIELLKEIRKQTQAPYSDIAKGIRIYKLDKTAIINYLREIAIVYAQTKNEGKGK